MKRIIDFMNEYRIDQSGESERKASQSDLALNFNVHFLSSCQHERHECVFILKFFNYKYVDQ